MTTMNLFQLTEELLQLERIADNAVEQSTNPETGNKNPTETSEYIDKAFWDYLEGVDGDYAKKVTAYIMRAKNLDAMAEARWKRIEEITAAAKAEENEAMRLRETVKRSMQARGVTEVKPTSPDLKSIKVIKNGGKPSLKIAEGFMQIPDEWYTTPEPVPFLDKARIREAIEGGEILDFAELVPPGFRLAVK